MVEQKQESHGATYMQAARDDLLERIQHFEQIYEIASTYMAKAVSLGVVRETAEISEWMQAYQKRLSMGDGYKGEKIITRPSESVLPSRGTKSTAQSADGKELAKGPGKIAVRKVSAQEMYDEMSSSVREFERRYEMDSADMLELLSHDLVRETGDILKWMFDYRVLQGLEQKGIPTAGTPGTTT